jgi:hypothetical protein
MADNPLPPTQSYPTALSVGTNGPIKFFLNTAAQQAVEKAFAGLPPDTKGISVQLQAETGHVAAVVAVKVSEGITIAGAWDRVQGVDGKTGNKYEGILRWTFK